MADKKKVAILGGGIGGLSTAYEILSKRPEWEITVYEMGWRLGGKCAASRNQSVAHRVEEHGIHAFFGCYENAFHLMRRVYAEIGRDWERAFDPQRTFTLFDSSGGEWERWDFNPPVRAGAPGDRLFNGQYHLPSLGELAKELIAAVWKAITDHFHAPRALHIAAEPLELLNASVEQVMERLTNAPSLADVTAVRGLLEKAFEHFKRLEELESKAVALVERVVDRTKLGSALRKLRAIAEIGFAAAAGVLDVVAHHTPLADLDKYDLTEWLNKHALGGAGLSEKVAKSALLRMPYEGSFAYEEGDPERPNFAAGTVLRSMLRLFLDYRGSIAYKMKPSTAEAIISPLYSALKSRHVRFEFFHRVDKIDLSDDGRNVAAIHFSVQSKAVNEPYDPLVDGEGWPDKPKYGLLVNGDILGQSDELEGGGYDLEALRTAAPVYSPRVIKSTTLDGGATDSFDYVVLAIPIGASKAACAALVHSPAVGARWQQMYDNLKTIPTQACQLWFDRTTANLGWLSPDGLSALVGCYEQPFGNWVDQSGVIGSEKWDQKEHVLSVAYLCGPLVETEDLKAFQPPYWREKVGQNAEKWLQEHAAVLWPHAFVRGEFDWDRLVSIGGNAGKQRLADQFRHANLTMSGRYVQSLEGTTKYRMAPNESGVANLVLAGDWTRNGANIGCVEATVMSARLATRAVLGLTKDELPVYDEGA